MHLHVYNIVYTGREKILSITGNTALQNFIDQGIFNCYDAESAPKEYDFELDATLELDELDLLEQRIKAKLTDDLGLSIKSFSYITS